MTVLACYYYLSLRKGPQRGGEGEDSMFLQDSSLDSAFATIPPIKQGGKHEDGELVSFAFLKVL